ncbi:MAG: hypothetical protein AB1531_05920 [Chloroflexota bacterium]
MDAEIQRLSDTLIYEIVNAVGLPRSRFWFRVFHPIFHKAAERMAAIGITLDRKIAEQGAPLGTGWALTNWCRDLQARGRENVPPEGPLLVVSNHSGTYDSFVICSQAGRKDFKAISSDIPFFKNLPHVAEHAIFLTDRTPDRTAAARAGIRHLQNGGMLLVFGTGLIDPDPAVYPDAERHIERWSPSIDLFLRTVPDLKLVACIVSGVVSRKWARHPVTWLRRGGVDKRRIAEFGQVLQQLFRPGSLYLTPRISFAPPVDAAALRRESNSERLLPAVIARGKALLADHCNFFSECAMLKERKRR